MIILLKNEDLCTAREAGRRALSEREIYQSPACIYKAASISTRTAGKQVGGRGGCHLTKLARWTRGWGVSNYLIFLLHFTPILLYFTPFCCISRQFYVNFSQFSLRFVRCSKWSRCARSGSPVLQNCNINADFLWTCH